MSFVLCLLMTVVSSTSQAEEDLVTVFPDDVPYTRYLHLDNTDDEKEREHNLAVVSFVLNSISNKKKIVAPTFINKEKTLIRFDIRDYGIHANAYNSLGIDPYTKKSAKLIKMIGCDNPLMRADWFIVKAMTAPIYYKLLGVSNLKDFRSRYGDDGSAKKARTEQAAIVVLSNLARNTRHIKRIPTVAGAIWESRDSASVDYLIELLSEKYDSIQLLAFNNNGLISYFAADNKGKALDHLNIDIAIDHSKAFEPDAVVRMVRNCVACHSTGVLPINDTVRNTIKDIKLLAPDKDTLDRLTDLFSTELPIEKDQGVYKEALMKATGMDPKTFTHKFISVWKIYYNDLTLEQAAKEVGVELGEFKKQCINSGHIHLVGLALRGKIARVHFEKALEGK